MASIAFIETALRSTGISGVALRVHLLGKRGYGADAATFTLFFETVYLGVAMGSAILFGVVYLLRAGDITTVEIAWLIAVFLLLAEYLLMPKQVKIYVLGINSLEHLEYPPRILVFAPHNDDETLGQGGVIANAVKSRFHYWVRL